jgi:P27 family predicted phage terminase small subunit
VGRRGPAPAPASLKLIKGKGPGRDSAGRPVNEPPKFRRGAPDAPAMLSDLAREEWDRIVPGLDELDLLKAEDFAALVEHCETWATYVEAVKLVREDGIVLVNPDNGRKYKNPALAAAEAAGQQLRASCREFGLTPSSEQNVGKPMRGTGGDGAEDDPFAAAASS